MKILGKEIPIPTTHFNLYVKQPITKLYSSIKNTISSYMSKPTTGELATLEQEKVAMHYLGYAESLSKLCNNTSPILANYAHQQFLILKEEVVTDARLTFKFRNTFLQQCDNYILEIGLSLESKMLSQEVETIVKHYESSIKAFALTSSKQITMLISEYSLLYGTLTDLHNKQWNIFQDTTIDKCGSQQNILIV